ncbi:LOW QUALITY PROTEIN: hypothetical protein U9M48_015369 [Paspalum notatum var. saurae]|uniref:Uncharacterized protein n=1 Tax=Paspalum notatum var. saurae TaxID=547442 RepID=A0AAQ3T4Q8_PASNO
MTLLRLLASFLVTDGVGCIYLSTNRRFAWEFILHKHIGIYKKRPKFLETPLIEFVKLKLRTEISDSVRDDLAGGKDVAELVPEQESDETSYGRHERRQDDGEGVKRDLRVRQHAGEEDEHLEVPDLEREHHGGGNGELGELGQVGERGPGEAGPRAPAPGAPHDVHELARDQDPPGEAERERGPQQAEAQPVDGEAAERHVEREAGGQDVGAGRHDALRLQELLDGEVGGVGEDLRDEAANSAAAPAISGDWPSSSRMGSEKAYMAASGTPVAMSSTVERCRYTPSISYFSAPYACPHSVSTALPIPSCIHTRPCYSTYHETVGEDLDAVVAEGGGGELDVAELAAHDLRRGRHDDDEHVDDDGGRGKGRQQPQLQRRGRRHAPEPRTAALASARAGEQRLQPAVDGAVVTRPTAAAHRNRSNGWSVDRDSETLREGGAPVIGGRSRPQRQSHSCKCKIFCDRLIDDQPLIKSRLQLAEAKFRKQKGHCWRLLL